MSKKVALSSLGVMIASSISFTLARNGVVGQAYLWQAGIISWQLLKSPSETWSEETSPRCKIWLSLKPFEFSKHCHDAYART